MERIEGVPLWQVGDLGAWRAAARWLAQLHAQPVPASREVAKYDAERLLRTFRLATTLPRADVMAEQVAARLAALPPAPIHGEFYPSHILVDRGGSVRESG
jgi:hypothetical protein